jgi:exodeoxyribonuclease VII small subunit
MKDEELTEDGPEPVHGSGEALSLEARLRRLDEIVSSLEGGEMELERGLALFEEGVGHIRECEKLIAQVELRVEELVGKSEQPKLRPLSETTG